MAYKKYKSNAKDRPSAEDKATKLIEQTNEKIKTFKHNPENVMDYLNFLSQFNQYSARNNMLIQNQRKGAIAIATFPKFKELGYAVNRGEKSMQILRPNIYEYFKRPDTEKIESVSKANEDEKKLIAEKKLPVFTKRTFSQMNVFDVTQTNMPKEDYPKIYPNAHVDFVFNGNDIENFNTALKHYSTNDLKIPVSIEHYDDLAKGRYYPLENQISLNDKNTPTENAHTLIHELSHSKMHNWKDIDSKDNVVSSTNVKEYQAEMATYVVAKHFGLDTEDHSVNYISGWTDNLNKIEDENLFDIYSEVSNTSKEMVTEISKTIEELGLEKETTEMSGREQSLYPEDTDDVTYCNITGNPIAQEEAVYYCEGDLTYYKEEEMNKVLSEREIGQLYQLDLMYYTDKYYDNEEELVPSIPESIPPRESDEELRSGVKRIFLQEYITNRIGVGTSNNLKEPLIEIAEPTNTFKKGEYFSSSELKMVVKADIEKDPELAESPLAIIVKTNSSNKPNEQENITKTTYKDSINILENEENKLNEKNTSQTRKIDLENER